MATGHGADHRRRGNIDLSVGSLLGLDRHGHGPAPDRLASRRLRLGFDHPCIWVIALAVGLALGALIGGLPGLHHRLPRRARPSSSRSAGCSSGAAPSGRARERPDDRADGPDLPAPRRRPEGSIGGTLAAGSSGSSPVVGDRAASDQRPAPAPAVRLPAPADVGRGAARRRRLRASSSARSGSPTAIPGRWPRRRSTRGAQHHRPAGGLQIPPGIAVPGR